MLKKRIQLTLLGFHWGNVSSCFIRLDTVYGYLSIYQGTVNLTNLEAGEHTLTIYQSQSPPYYVLSQASVNFTITAPVIITMLSHENAIYNS